MIMEHSPHSLPVACFTQGLDRFFVFNFFVHSFLIWQVMLILKVLGMCINWYTSLLTLSVGIFKQRSFKNFQNKAKYTLRTSETPPCGVKAKRPFGCVVAFFMFSLWVYPYTAAITELSRKHNSKNLLFHMHAWENVKMNAFFALKNHIIIYIIWNDV